MAERVKTGASLTTLGLGRRGWLVLGTRGMWRAWGRLRGLSGEEGISGRGGSRRGCGRSGESFAPGRLGLLSRDFSADILEFGVVAEGSGKDGGIDELCC